MKRFLAVLLCMVLCVSMLPSAYAADIEIVEIETPEDAELISIIDPAAEIGQEKAAEPAVDMDAVKYSGTCGDNALWSIDDEGVMTITGTGAMYDYGKGDSPWYSYRETVKKAVVGNGITVIGSNTFRYCSNLKSVSLPSSITSINAKAFIGCTGLSSITLPKNIKEIGESMFEGCTGLKNIEVPSAVTTLGKYAFYNSGLTQITLPASLKSIGSQAFTSCASLSKVYYLGTGAAWSNISISSGNDPLLNAELIIYSKPAITTHPATVTKAAGETAKFTVKATGTNLSYQWQYRTGAGQSWSNSWLTGYNSATLTVKAESYREGYQYRCKISNSLGTVYTNNAALHVKAKPAVTTQPQSITTSADTTVKFSVKATGSDLSYQWQYRTGAGATWYNSTMSGCKTATMTVKATAARNGYQYRCKVSNSLGSVYTNAATLTVKQVKPVITGHPKTTTAEPDTTVKFTVQATGAESYQWQYRTGAGATWYNSTMSGCKTATMTVKATTARDGYQYRCKVTNSVGSTYSNNAALHVQGSGVVTYRALLVGEVNFSWETANRNKGDVQLLENMLKSVKGAAGGAYSVTSKYNLSNEGIQNAISSAFSGADSDDVSLFFIATHGVVNVETGPYAGELVTIGANGYEEYLTLGELATWLKAVPGKVIVLLGSCGSGAAIVENGVVKYVVSNSENAEDAFNAAAIQAFAALDEELPDEDGIVANTGEFRNSKFYVMTAAQHQESSWGSEYYGYNYFTYYFANGATDSKPADANGNGTITMLEMYNYVKANAYGPYNDGTGDYYQHVQMYPANSAYELFK